MGANHGGLHVLLAEKFLNGPDMVAALRAVRKPQRMAIDPLGATLARTGLNGRHYSKSLDYLGRRIAPDYRPTAFLGQNVPAKKHPSPGASI